MSFTPGQLWVYSIRPDDSGGPVHVWSLPQGNGIVLSVLSSGDPILILSVRPSNPLISGSGEAVSVEVMAGYVRGWLWLVRDNVISRRFKMISAP